MAPQPQRLTITHRAWPLARPQPGAEAAETVLAELYDGNARGRGEAVPLHRFGESVASVRAQLEAVKGAVSSGLNRETLQDALPPGAARNALDCAFWDIDAKRTYCAASDLAGAPAPAPGPVATSFRLAPGTEEAMAAEATAQSAQKVLMLDLAAGSVGHAQAVRQAAPGARLVVDAGGAWDLAQLQAWLPALLDARVEMIVQPLAADADAALAGWAHPVPLCADASCRTIEDLDRIAGRYAAVAVGLDKAGGLTAALALAGEARRRGLLVRVTGSVGTSLGVAPALLVVRPGDAADLDGPQHLAIDRGSGLRYRAGMIDPADPRLWGGPE